MERTINGRKYEIGPRASLSGANLRWAYLGEADLSGASLSGADLRWANLGGANLGNQWIIQGGTRTDGHQFRLQKLTGDKVPVVCAGCRNFTLAEAQAWWESASYPSPALAAETRVIVRALVDIAHMRGLMKVGA